MPTGRHRTTGPQGHRARGPQDHRATRPQGHKLTKSQGHKATLASMIFGSWWMPLLGILKVTALSNLLSVLASNCVQIPGHRPRRRHNQLSSNVLQFTQFAQNSTALKPRNEFHRQCAAIVLRTRLLVNQQLGGMKTTFNYQYGKHT